MSARAIEVRIGAFDDFSLTMSKFNAAMGSAENAASTTVSKLRAHFNNLKEHWVGASVAIAAASLAIHKAWGVAENAAAFEEQKQALNNLAGQYNLTADTMIEAIQRAADGTVSKMDAIGVANKALIMGLDPSKMEVLLSASKRLSGATGGDTVAAFEKLSTAVATGQERQLKNLGIIVDLEGAYKRYGDNLTEVEKQTINFDVVSRALDDTLKRMGPDSDTAADAMERFTAVTKDLSLTFGKVLISAASFTSGGLLWLSSGFATLTGHIAGMLSKIVSMGEYLPWVGDRFKGASEALAKFSQLEKDAAENAMRMSLESFKVGSAIWKETEAVQKKIEATEKAKAAKEAESIFKREMLRLDMEEEKIYEDMTARYTKRRMMQLDADAKAAEAKRLLREEERLTALSRLAETEDASPYKPQEGEGGQLGSVYMEYQNKMAALKDYNTQRIQLMINAGKSQYEIEAEHERLTTEMKNREYQMRLGAAASFAGNMANLFQNLYTASGKKNRALFELAKAFAIAEAVMNTAKAATQALAFPPGPPISFAYVAAAVAAGAAQIATIASTKPGDSGGAISAGGTASAPYTGGSANAQPVPMRLDAESKAQQTVTVNVYALDPSNVNWDRMVEDNITPALERMSGDRNVELNIKVSQR